MSKRIPFEHIIGAPLPDAFSFDVSYHGDNKKDKHYNLEHHQHHELCEEDNFIAEDSLDIRDQGASSLILILFSLWLTIMYLDKGDI